MCRCVDFTVPRSKCALPGFNAGFIAGLLPWLSAVQYKTLCLDIRRAFSFIVLGRDKGESGRVTLDAKDRKPRLTYPLENHDRASLMDGLVVAARIAAACGATSIGSSFASMGLTELPPMPKRKKSSNGTTSTTDDDLFLEMTLRREEAVDAFCARLREHGITTDYRTLLFSAHQMGTCKMGASKDVSVVDENGETWNCEGLYVCDASVFPTSSGVNPMLTTLAIADGVADVIAKVVAVNSDGGKRRSRL